MNFTVELPPLIGQQAAAWTALMLLAPDLGTQWTLIGGQMVLLHQAERQGRSTSGMRLTTDLDVVVNLRTIPAQRNGIHQVLIQQVFYAPCHLREQRGSVKVGSVDEVDR